MKEERDMETKTPRMRRPKRADVRRRLLRAAERLFFLNGFERTTLEEIAETAGFSKGAVYSNFKNKDELFFTLMEGHITERLQIVEDSEVKDGSMESVGLEIGRLLSAIGTKDRQWQILFLEYWLRAVRMPTARERFAGKRAEVRDQIGKYLEEKAKLFNLKPPIGGKELATVILALSNGLGIETLIDPESVSNKLFGQILLYLYQGMNSAVHTAVSES